MRRLWQRRQAGARRRLQAHLQQGQQEAQLQQEALPAA
jgi:hypothetical protein